VASGLKRKEAKELVVQHVILVGGFSGSDYLFEQVSQALHAKSFSVVRPDNHVYVSSIPGGRFPRALMQLLFVQE
jgi:hypothetical protein